jgi:hypothetical protein
MSYNDSNEIDRWYEYQEQRREAEEWQELEQQKEREIQKALQSMTEDEQTSVMCLNKKLKKARVDNSYGETYTKAAEEKRSRQAIYNAVLEEFNKAVEQWPILKNGF